MKGGSSDKGGGSDLLEFFPEHAGVLDGLAAALTQIWHHGVYLRGKGENNEGWGFELGRANQRRD
jgi:hypothetical protein